MAQITLDSKEWLAHVGQFSDVISDLVINVFETPNAIGYSAGYQTFFLNVSRAYPDAKAKAGPLTFSDLTKACAFLKKCSGDVTIKQVKNGSTLYLASGSFKLSLPVTDSKSQQLVKTYAKLVKEAKGNKWKTFGADTYTVHGRTKMSEILKLASLKNIVTKYGADYSVTMDVENEEISASAGKTHDAKIFASSTVTDVTLEKKGIKTVKSNFGPWLLPCLGLVDGGTTCRFHFGDASGLVIEQTETNLKRLLIIIDQQE
jgi:hypothetical protein